MKISSIKSQPNVFFRGYSGKTLCVNSNNKMMSCIHESHFMRNLESLNFTTNYIKENFPKGIHIGDFGCSNGEETYSLGVLLNPANADKKYKITGYDVAPAVIKDAKTGVMNIGGYQDNYEKFLVNDYVQLTPEEKSIKESFYKCFEKIPPKWMGFNIYHPSYKRNVRRFTNPIENLELAIRRLEYIHLPSERRHYGGSYFIPKNGVFDDVVNFKVLDIANIDKELVPNKTGAVIFKNSLYHILASRIDTAYDNIDITPAKELFKKINSILPEKGLFVLGILAHDHFQRYVKPSDCETIYQNGEQIKVFNSSPIHKLLKEAGFEPVFYECEKTSSENFIKLSTYLPSVWKKVRSII